MKAFFSCEVLSLKAVLVLKMFKLQNTVSIDAGIASKMPNVTPANDAVPLRFWLRNMVAIAPEKSR
jgi:hypothetical protein